MGEVNFSNLKKPENMIKMLIIVLSLTGFAMLLTALKCYNNNIHIPNNLIYNRLISSSYYRPAIDAESISESGDVQPPAWSGRPFESVHPVLTPGMDHLQPLTPRVSASLPASNQDAHHAFECALFKYKIKNSELFLLLINFTYFFVTCLTFVTCFVSEGFTHNMDIMFHIIGFFFYLCSTVWILVDETEVGKSYDTRKSIVASASIGLITGMLHFIHALFCIKFT